MPIYGYRCVSCDKEFETLLDVNESAAQPCPECGGEAKRLYYPVGIIFKGSGFHVTDYPSKRRAEKGAKADGDTSKPSDGGNAKPSNDKADRAED